MREDDLSCGLIFSFVAHASLCLIIFVRAILVPDEPIQVRNAIRVDVVALPKKITEPSPVEPSSPPASPSTAPAKPIVTQKPPPLAPTLPDKKKGRVDVTQKEKQALNKLKALEALDKIQNDVKREKSEARAKEARAQLIEGNRESAGNALSGLAKIEYDRYFDDLKNKVLSQWNIPQWLAEREFKASVQVLIDEHGYVLKKVMRRSSGNEIFDAKALEAIDASSPLPEPPQRLRGLLSTSGITFNFPE